VEGFKGPLDFLLEMVRRQRVDLGPLPILTLTDQRAGTIENSDGTIRLERRPDWLVLVRNCCETQVPPRAATIFCRRRGQGQLRRERLHVVGSAVTANPSLHGGGNR